MRCAFCGIGLEPETRVAVEARGAQSVACPGCAAELSYAAPWRALVGGAMPPAYEPARAQADLEGFESDRSKEQQRRRPVGPRREDSF